MNLSTYLETKNLTAAEFALAEPKIPITSVTRLLRKERGKDKGRGVSPSTAAKISAKTMGAVTIQDLLYPEGIENGARLAECQRKCANS